MARCRRPCGASIARKQRDKPFAGAQRTQNPVVPVTHDPARATMSIDGQPVPLTPAMAVSAEIATGNRTSLE